MFAEIPAKRKVVRMIRRGFRSEGTARVYETPLPVTPVPGEELIFTNGKERVQVVVRAYAWNSGKPENFDLVLRPTPTPS
jgi:hypothetical protein